MAVHWPKQMTDGGWKVALYLNDRATPEQSEALGAIFSGAAREAILAALVPLIGEVSGVTPAADHVSIVRTARYTPRSPVFLPCRREEIKGIGRRVDSPVITNPLLIAVTQPMTQAKAGDVSYHDDWDVEYSGTNSFVTDFKYEG